MTETAGRQVDWFIPKTLYARLRALHDWSQEVNFVGVSPSEHDFALTLLDDAISRGEKVRRAYEKAQRVIIDPTEEKKVVI